MRKLCKITINDQSFFANRGDLLLDAALLNGVDLPHDCRSGICGACRVQLVEGRVFRHQDGDSDLIHACQARVISNLQITKEETPETLSISARVARLTRLSPDIVEVCLKLSKPLRFLPGQFCKVQFRGYPARSFSPTFPLEGAPNHRLLHFHIRIVAGGKVSSALGHQIKIGYGARVTGPFGAAFLRPDHRGGTVLVSSGTGFAPLWSIAVAAIFERPQRELIFIVGARSLQSLYMLGALCRLARFPNVTIVPVVSEAHNFSETIRVGRPSDHMPNLSPDDVVYTAGAPGLTAHVAEIAKTSGAKCYADPFVAEETQAERLNPLVRMAAWLGGELRGSHDGPRQPSLTPATRSDALVRLQARQHHVAREQRSSP